MKNLNLKFFQYLEYCLILLPNVLRIPGYLIEQIRQHFIYNNNKPLICIYLSLSHFVKKYF